jgi:hypothetical protein
MASAQECRESLVAVSVRGRHRPYLGLRLSGRTLDSPPFAGRERPHGRGDRGVSFRNDLLEKPSSGYPLKANSPETKINRPPSVPTVHHPPFRASRYVKANRPAVPIARIIGS